MSEEAIVGDAAIATSLRTAMAALVRAIASS
jgi:hypothetical protein